MKKLSKILTITAIFLFIATSAFSFQWISFQNEKSDMMVQGSLGYGSFVVIPVEVFPAGAIFETKIPGVKNLSAGGGIGFLGIVTQDAYGSEIEDDYLTLSAYAKYIFLNSEQVNDLIHFPVYVGVAAGLGYEALLGTGSISYKDVNHGGLQALAVGLVGYNMGWATATIYPGIIDNKFTVSGDFNFNLGDRMHLGLFWVPLIGLGASFTYAL